MARSSKIPIRDEQGLKTPFELRYREVTISILEVAPPVDELPYCQAEKRDGALCNYHARFLRDGKPSCRPHLTSKETLFMEND